MSRLQRTGEMTPERSSPLRISIIDGSAGLRLLLASIIKTRYPDASLEVIDPFSQTMRGASFLFGTRGDVIIMGGLGTRKDTLDAIARLAGREDCAPIIMLGANELTRLPDEFIAAGAFDVLRKDALSSTRLYRSIARAVAAVGGTGTDSMSIAGAVDAMPRQPDIAAGFGEFVFVWQGNRTAVEIDGYRFLSCLASGPHAEVFFAEHIDRHEQVVMKMFTDAPLSNIGAVSAICTRQQLLGGCQSPHIVRTIDTGVTSGFLYVVMEYLVQGDLRRRMKNDLDSVASLTIMAGILDALIAFHALGLVHADLKPESVFFRPDNSVVLIDFDIATPAGQSVDGSRAAKSGKALGTPVYVSPEQGAGMPIETTADIYSAGIILTELFTGDVPFSGDTAAQVIFRHIHDEIPLLPLRIRHLQPLIDQMLAKQPADRFQSAAAAKRALQTFLPVPPRDAVL